MDFSAFCYGQTILRPHCGMNIIAFSSNSRSKKRNPILQLNIKTMPFKASTQYRIDMLKLKMKRCNKQPSAHLCWEF